MIKRVRACVCVCVHEHAHQLPGAKYKTHVQDCMCAHECMSVCMGLYAAWRPSMACAQGMASTYSHNERWAIG